MLRLTYGYHVEKEDDPFLTGAITALRNFGKLTTPGAFLVDLIPACGFLTRFFFENLPINILSEIPTALDAWYFVPQDCG